MSVVAGSRHLVVAPGPRGRRNGTAGTALRWNEGKRCIMLLLDGGGRGGAGDFECFEPGALQPLPPLTLRSILEREERRVPQRTRARHVGTSHQSAPADRSWAAGLDLPSYVLDTSAPTDDELELLRQPERRRHPAGEAPFARRPVLPSLFMPGFPKSATTWLYRCMLDAFSPQRVGCGDNASRWNASTCGRRFLLTPVYAMRWSRHRPTLAVEPKKESFFFGGTRHNLYRPDLLTLHGPDPSRGTLASEPPLWPWDPHRTLQHAVRRERGHGPTRQEEAAAQRELMRRFGAMCAGAQKPCSHLGVGAPALAAERKAAAAAGASSVGGVPLDACVHAACTRVVRSVPRSSGPMCSWNERASTQLGLNETYCVSSLTPWARPRELRMALADFTPNYLCDARAMMRLRAAVDRPGALRFIVLMREPMSRAFSEWAMFALKWAWDPIPSFEASLAVRVNQLRDCNRTLFRNVEALRALPTHELSAYLTKCWSSGAALMYAQTSMYSVCVLHALRHFERRQFLFLRYEDALRMPTDALLRLLARFTGLHIDDGVVAAAKRSGQCRPDGGKRRPGTYSALSPSEKVLYNRSAARVASAAGRSERDALFKPYDELLAEIVHPQLSWRERKQGQGAAEKGAAAA